jgi:hypothetical protein
MGSPDRDAKELAMWWNFGIVHGSANTELSNTEDPFDIEKMLGQQSMAIHRSLATPPHFLSLA